MLDTVCIVNFGGVVLWQRSAHETRRRAQVNRLISTVLLEDRSGAHDLVVDDCRLYWALHNEAKLIAVAVCSKFVVVHGVNAFLAQLARAYAAQYAPVLASLSSSSRVNTRDCSCDDDKDVVTMRHVFDGSAHFDANYDHLLDTCGMNERQACCVHAYNNAKRRGRRSSGDGDGGDEDEKDERAATPHVSGVATVVSHDGNDSGNDAEDGAGMLAPATTTTATTTTAAAAAAAAHTSAATSSFMTAGRDGKLLVTRHGKRIVVRGARLTADDTMCAHDDANKYKRAAFPALPTTAVATTTDGGRNNDNDGDGGGSGSAVTSKRKRRAKLPTVSDKANVRRAVVIVAENDSGNDDTRGNKSHTKSTSTTPTMTVADGGVTCIREAQLQAQAERQKATLLRRLPNGDIAPMCEGQWDDADDHGDDHHRRCHNSSGNGAHSRLTQWLHGCLGRQEVNAEALQRILPQLRDKLLSKNVAVEVAQHVCTSVEATLAGTHLRTLDSLQRHVEEGMTAALRRILQPSREIDVLRDVAAAAATRRGRPYTIVFCGVNGVGKSTTLAKVAYWLTRNNLRVLLAAGDTFRHGAVEQLLVHSRCLDVPLFQMGYGADPSAVAAAAVAQASRQHMDVVLVDTAGRMQDHEPRMRALAKLIHDNTPDLVLFVGEAVVGNNGVDQLRKFNRCLVDYAPVGAPCRGIDGLVLTKFDTMDDKVGAALSMVYELGQPIVFVGVGQAYQDLKVLNAEVVVRALML